MLSIFIFVFSCVEYAVSMDCSVANSSKLDCGRFGTTESECLSFGCCWSPEPTIPVPWCYFPMGADNCFFVKEPSSIPPFNSTEIDIMKGYFVKNLNIEGSGGVVASPDKDTPGGSYYYHWERDGALSMRALMMISDYDYYNLLMQNYVHWVLKVQNETDPHSQDVRTEPKYDLPTAEVYKDQWCRPQCDGPALRATTLIIYANELFKRGEFGYIKSYLWTNDESEFHGGAIKYDLDWVAENWESEGCDLWEEIRSDDFFWNRMNYKKAMFEGSDFAYKMELPDIGEYYKTAGITINNTLMSHYYNNEYIFQTKSRMKDAAVITALNDGYYEKDGMLSPIAKEVVGTIDELNSLFCLSFHINQIDTSTRNIPGVLYGRYQGDQYAGGNPWILTTGSLAELLYRGAIEVINKGMPDEEAMGRWARVLQRSFNSDIDKLEFANLLVSGGDSVLDRIAYHVRGAGFHLSEQLDKNSGFEVSATDLTWSYATVLKACYLRNSIQKLLNNL